MTETDWPALSKKQKKAERVEAKFENKAIKIRKKISESKNIPQFEKRYMKLRTKEAKAAEKIKAIKEKGVTLPERSEDLLNRVEMAKKQQEADKVIPMKKP